MDQKKHAMKRSKKPSVLLHLDTSHKRKEDGKSRFYLKVRVHGVAKLYDITPASYMDRKFWVHEVDLDSGEERKKMRIQHAKGNLDSRRLERLLLSKVDEMVGIMEELSSKGQGVTHASLEQRWKGPTAKTFVGYIQARMEEERSEVRETTYRNWKTYLVSLQGYDPHLLLLEVTPEWLRSYEEYLRNAKPNKKSNEGHGGKGLSQNTVTAQFAFLRKHLKDACMRDLLPKNPMEIYLRESKARKRLRYVTPKRHTLMASEIERLHKAYESEEFLKMFEADTQRAQNTGLKCHDALQQILASIYSGFRFSDISQFQSQMNVTVTDTHIKLEMKKVKKLHMMKISNKLRSVLCLDNGGSLFHGPILTNGTMNKYLRKVLELLGIDKHMSWHDLRRTFATQLHAMNVDIKKVSKLLGHSSVVVTEKYVKVHDHDLDKAIEVWDDDLEAPTAFPDRKLLGLVADLVEMNPGIHLPNELQRMIQPYLVTR